MMIPRNGATSRCLKPGLGAVVAVAALVLTACGGGSGQVGSAPTTTATTAPTQGGSAVLGGLTLVQFDPGQPGYIPSANAYMGMVYGRLLTNPAKTGGAPTPAIATKWSYNSDKTALTMDLRVGVKFTDGTAVDAAAVKWNIERYALTTSYNNTYWGSLTSINTPTPSQVVFHFSSPQAHIVNAIATTSAGYLGSPTAFTKMGAKNYALSPVGAGAFKITRSVASQEMDLARNVGYYDASHVYLNTVTLKNTGIDESVQYTNVESGSLSLATFPGISSSPSVIQQATSNPNLAVAKTPNVAYYLMPVNTYSPPFNNPIARQAIATCTDRESLAKDVQQGFATAAYALTGTDGLYLPEGGMSALKEAYPYPYSVDKGKALVQQLGGTLNVQLSITGSPVLGTALQQMWKECGINATVKTLTAPQLQTDEEQGAYQIAIGNSGGFAEPSFAIAFQVPTTPVGKFGFKDATVAADLTKTYATDDPTELTKLWGEIWATENKLAVAIPLISGGRYVVYDKCLQGIQFLELGADLTHAYRAC
jgi:peptide/nickel transport system substrate-binding protein